MANRTNQSFGNCLTGKNAMRNGLGLIWSLFAMCYIVLLTIYNIPEANRRMADSFQGFILGTVCSTILHWYFASTQSSNEKNDLLAQSTTAPVTPKPIEPVSEQLNESVVVTDAPPPVINKIE